jgi:DNA-binding XRE family transcriptional regulator
MSERRYIEKWITFEGQKRLLRLRVPDILERKRIIDEIQIEVAEGQLTLGKAIRRLRRECTDLPQDVFAKVLKLSTRTLANLEADTGNPTLHSLTSVFRAFGLRMSLESTNTLTNEDQLIARLNRRGLQVKCSDTESP